MKKKGLLLIFALLLVVTGCSSVGISQSKGNQDKPLTIGLDDDPPQLDPHKSSAAVDRQVYQSIYNTLVDIDENLKIVPELAQSWTISKDGLTYTFNLRHDVLFHDGTKFNADAVKFNFDRMLDPKFGSPRQSEINLINKITLLNPYKIQIHLSKPFTPFLSILTDRSGMMVSPTAVKKEGNNYSLHPVGTGPYQFVNRVKQDHITVKAFPKYWGTKPKIKTIVYKPYSDGNVRLTNLTAGSVDIVNTIQYKDINQVKTNPYTKVSEKGAIGFQGIGLNVNKAPFNNKKVRQAVNLAIDRHAIAKVIYHDGVTPANSPFPTDSWAHNPNVKVPRANINKAKQLIKESGMKNISFTLKIPPKPEEQQLGQIVQSMLAQAGIKVKLELVEFGTLLQQGTNHEFQAIRIGWSGRIDPDGTAYSWFTSKGSNNDMGYSNPGVDQLFNKARTLPSQKGRQALYFQASKKLWDDAPYIFLFYPNDYKAMKKQVHGYNHIGDTMIRPDTIYFSK